MFRLSLILAYFWFASCTTLPDKLILRKVDPELQYAYDLDSNYESRLVDGRSDAEEGRQYNPVTDNAYHLFTRENPSASQPLVINNEGILTASNFNGNRRTIILIHGWRNNATSTFNAVLVPAFLNAEDLNVIVVDWSAGATSINFRAVIENTLSSGAAVASFIDWLNQITGAYPIQYHIVGHGFGGHQAGIVGRNVQGQIAYITGLDPAQIGWINHIHRFDPLDALYTEVIHTNYAVHGYLEPLAKVDIYPNGGTGMPGCNSNACDHERSFWYFAESIVSGGFLSRQCLNHFAAIMSMCDILPGRLNMGGLRPKIGRSGVYFLETNEAPPFSLN